MVKRKGSKKRGRSNKKTPRRTSSYGRRSSMPMMSYMPMSSSSSYTPRRKSSGSMGYLLMFLVLVAVVAVVISMSSGNSWSYNTPTPTPTAAPSGVIGSAVKSVQDATGLSGGAIAGIVIVLVFLLFGGGAMLVPSGDLDITYGRKGLNKIDNARAYGSAKFNDARDYATSRFRKAPEVRLDADGNPMSKGALKARAFAGYDI
jgi:hypothetical protein